MNWSRFIWAAVVVFVTLVVTGIIIHVLIFRGAYENLSAMGIFQPQNLMMSYFWVELITAAVYAFFFTLIFIEGYKGRGYIEAVRFAIYITLFFWFVTSFDQFVFYGLPYGIVWLWIIAGFIQNLIMAILAVLIYKPKAAAA